jgi:hypothetical protein
LFGTLCLLRFLIFAEIAGHSPIRNRLVGPSKKMALKSATKEDQSSGVC